MEIIVTQHTQTGTIAEAKSADGRYTWFWGRDGYIKDTIAGRSVYQMSYMRTNEFGCDPLPDDVAADIRAFWGALHSAQDALAEQRRKSYVSHAPAPIDAGKAAHYHATMLEGGDGFNPYCDGQEA